MNRLRSASWLVRISLAVAAIGLGLAAVSFARAIPPNTIHSCVKNYGAPLSTAGDVRIILPTQSCVPGETTIDWPATGGTGGVNGREVIVATSGIVVGGTNAIATCSSGKLPLGGGVTLIDSIGNPLEVSPAVAIVVQNSPSVAGTGWVGSAEAISASNTTSFGVKVYAVCAFAGT